MIEKYHSLIIWPKIQFFYASLRNAYFGWRLWDRGEKNACVIYLSADPSIHPSIATKGERRRNKSRRIKNNRKKINFGTLDLFRRGGVITMNDVS